MVDNIWSEEERLTFISYIAKNPNAGDVIPKAEGARKVRWAAKGGGKRGGVRIIYFNLDEEGVVYLIAIYTKSDKSNMTPKEIKQKL